MCIIASLVLYITLSPCTLLVSCPLLKHRIASASSSSWCPKQQKSSAHLAAAVEAPAHSPPHDGTAASNQQAGARTAPGAAVGVVPPAAGCCAVPHQQRGAALVLQLGSQATRCAEVCWQLLQGGQVGTRLNTSPHSTHLLASCRAGSGSCMNVRAAPCYQWQPSHIT